MWLVISLCRLLFWPSINAADDSVKNYDGYKVYNLTLDTAKQFNFVKKYNGVDGYDFWLLPVHGNAHLMVVPELQSSFEKEIKKNRIDFTIINEDVGESILRESESEDEPGAIARVFEDPDASATYNFEYFPRYRKIEEFIKNLLRNRKYSKIIKIGTSYEGRPIYGVEVKKSSNKPVFLIDAGIHAREWASHVAALYIIENVVENEEEFADKMSFVIIPCLNPDGYEYAHTTDRLWRKSLSRSNNSTCLGVDLNRNFDAYWGEFRSDKNPCSDIYVGSKAFSEPESQALRDAILKYKPVAYLTIHSFGPLILYPYGFSKNLPPNWRTLHRIAKNAAQRIKQVNGTRYVIGTAARVLYVASGGSDDWAFGAGVPIVYTMELPEYNNGSFIVPKKKIKPLVRETYEGFVSMVDDIYEKYSE